MSTLKMGNLALAFLLELAMLAALCYWGFQVGDGWLAKVLLGVGVPLAVAVLWGLFMAPRAAIRAPRPVYWLLFVVFFGGAALALAFAGQPALAIVFAVVVIINRTLISVIR